MGFREEIKVHLYTRSAQTSAGKSKATWRLNDSIRPPNPLYKMKVQVSNALVPNSFDKISADIGNNKLTFVYDGIKDDDTQTPASDYNVKDLIRKGQYVTIELAESVQNPTPGDIYGYLRAAMVEKFTSDDLVTATFDGTPVTDWTWKQMRYKPIVNYDGGVTGFQTFAFTFENWDTEAALPSTVGGLTETHKRFHNWKLVLPEDIEDTPLTPQDINLAVMLGFSDGRNAFFNGKENDPLGLVTQKGVIRASKVPNFKSIKFIKVMSDLNIQNLDPNTLTMERILTVIPVVESESEASMIYLAGGIQSPQYITIGDSSLDSITLELQKDDGLPLEVNDDWYLELTVLFEEPEDTPAYRGISDMGSTNAVDVSVDPDTASYQRLNQEINTRLSDIEALESGQRLAEQAADPYIGKRSRFFYEF